VTGTGNAPLANIEVHLFLASSPGSYYVVTTASDGTYSANVQNDTYTLYFWDRSGTYLNGYYSSSGFTLNSASATPVTVPPTATGINVQLAKGHNVKGTVTGTGGTPLANIEVDVFSSTYSGSSTTAANGPTQLMCPPAPMTSTSGIRAGLTQRLLQQQRIQPYFPNGSSSQLFGCDWHQRAARNGHFIKGTVTGRGGIPLSGIGVSETSSGYFSGFTTTASNGTYSVDVPAGSYTLYSTTRMARTSAATTAAAATFLIKARPRR